MSNPRCPCLTRFPGLDPAADIYVRIQGISYNYGVGYGLHRCAAHDAGKRPLCNVAAAPSWCSAPWCYVDASACAPNITTTASYYLGDTATHYSYEACDSSDETAFSGQVKRALPLASS